MKCDLAADVSRRFGVLRLRVTGFSMLPSIWPGDIACVSRVDAYRPGDVVLFSRNGRLLYTGSSRCRAAQWLRVGTRCWTRILPSR